MATFLVRAHDHRTSRALTAPSVNYFLDDNDSPHESSIDKAAGAGLTGGSADGTYRPGAPGARDQMASFLARLLDLLVLDAGARPPA